MHIHVERPNFTRPATIRSREEVSFVIADRVTALVSRSYHELLPLIHGLYCGCSSLDGACIPVAISCSTVHTERGFHHVRELITRFLENRRMILSIHNNERRVDILPRRNTHARAGSVAGGILREVEHDFSSVQRVARPSHRSVGRGFIDDFSNSLERRISAENEDVRRSFCRPIKGLRAEHVLVGQVPGKSSADLESVENLVSGFQKIRTELM